jgi:DUF4097 and DUF4098 domain-containing protein YvlB
MFRYVATLLYAFCAVALGSTDDFDKVNGSIEVEAGREAGDVSTVNGSIRIGSDARVQEVETVNGAIRIEPRATARSVETVNGSVTLGDGVVVSGNVEAVNGALTLESGARVEGRVENVNGDFELRGATVRGGLGTVNGDMRIGAGSLVDGGILVEKPGGWSWGGKSNRPTVTIESGATVNGTLSFEREVDLHVGSGAVVGPIEGVQPRRHALP